MRFARFAAAVMAAWFVVSAASAATVSVKFVGSLYYLDQNLTNPSVAVGDLVMSEFIFDDAQVGYDLNRGNIPNVAAMNYQFSGGSLSLPASGASYAFDPIIPGHIGILSRQTDTHHDFAFASSLDANSVRLDVLGFDFSRTALPSASIADLLKALADPSLFDLLLFDIHAVGDGALGDCATLCGIYGQISDIQVSRITAVPVPAALPLMALGLAGLGFVGRRRRG